MPAQNSLARRSFARRLQDSLYGVWGALAQNALLLGLALAAATLLALFFIGLTLLQPSSPGREIRLSEARALIDAKKDNAIAEATLRDQDARLELNTFGGEQLWTSYPHSDSYTSELLDSLD